MGFKPTITEFRSEALTDWVVKAWIRLAVRFNFCHCLRQSPDLSSSKSWTDNYMTLVEWIDRCGIHYWRIFKANYTESWLAWGLDPRPLSFAQTLQPTEISCYEFNQHSKPILYYSWNFIFRLVFRLHFGHFLRQYSDLSEWNSSTGSHMNVAERPDAYGIHH